MTISTTSESSQQNALPPLLNTIGLLGVSLTLLVAFYYQLYLSELPCPLCLLQRVGFIVAGIGFMLNLQFGARGTHYGIVIIGALTTAIIATRQVFLHILPGDPGYGSTFLGLHFYTWSLVSALLIILAVALVLIMSDEIKLSLPGLARGGRIASLLFVILIAANLASTLLECGTGPCEDNPTFYQLLGLR
ncbi:disulfide bond formation protein B [Aeromonas australiensis]|uniref:disulfide bond formation protein B n=1 Tax=Aeromonas australiensis TaxID=1114880 RepID=UPI00058A4BA8|nr:disulfide bond formation protein B [Aeromonas australiensis]